MWIINSNKTKLLKQDKRGRGWILLKYCSLHPQNGIYLYTNENYWLINFINYSVQGLLWVGLCSCPIFARLWSDALLLVATSAQSRHLRSDWTDNTPTCPSTSQSAVTSRRRSVRLPAAKHSAPVRHVRRYLRTLWWFFINSNVTDRMEKPNIVTCTAPVNIAVIKYCEYPSDWSLKVANAVKSQLHGVLMCLLRHWTGVLSVEHVHIHSETMWE